MWVLAEILLKMTVKDIGLSRIHGDQIGEKMATLDFAKKMITQTMVTAILEQILWWLLKIDSTYSKNL